jgi:hypothetical protein
MATNPFPSSESDQRAPLEERSPPDAPVGATPGPRHDASEGADSVDAPGEQWDEPLPQVRVGGYTEYADAQAAMDHLSDAGLDIGGAAITWSGLRKIEYVVGRRTTFTAARDGLLSGAWLGLVVSLLLLLFVEVDADTSELGLIATWTLVFAAVGAAWSAIMHASMRGTRDFTTLPRLEAERYDVWIDAPQAARARSLLGSRT